MVNNYKQDEEKTKFSWKNITRMIHFVKPYKKKLFFAFVMGILGSILLLIIPQIMKYAIDVSFVNKDFGEVVILAFMMFLIVILAVWFSKIKNDKMSVALNYIAHDIKVAIFTKLQYLPNSYYDTHSHGKIYTRATSYPDEVSVIFCYVLVQGFLDIIGLVFVLLFMLYTNVELSLISIGLSFVLIIFFIFLAPVRRKLQHVVNDKSSNVNAYLSESISGIRITQSFNREYKNENILKDLEKQRLDASKKIYYIGNLNWALSGLFNYISMALVYYFGLKYFYPAVSIGVILAVDSYSSRFWEPIEYLTSSYNDLMDASTYLERIFELLDEDLVIENKKGAIDLDIKGDIKFVDVNFGYNSEKIVLDHFNLDIHEGEKIGLVGETGCGKSTVLNLISRFYDVNGGEVLIDNVNVKDIKLDSLRGQIAMMLQDNFLFERSVYDNLVLDKKIDKKDVYKICKMLDIHEMINSLENGYDTVLLNNGSNLSSGEKQLLCIARIMIQNPKILILDEATSNIDLMTEKKLEKALKIVMKGRTTIMVAHRISTIKNCDKIVLIKDHINYEEGTHKDLMKKKKDYYKLYSSQAIK